ncbi:MAG: ATP-dependent DNA ligase [Caldilineaceae bacterium]|nr:ATP-dependent DNA ligase [Caldilineaceae bacterium]
MQRFTALYTALDETNRTNEKVAALVDYFASAPAADAAWALYFLTGRRLGRVISGTLLRTWVAEESRLPLWLVEECYDAVGDLAETLALLLPDTAQTIDLPLHQLVEERIKPISTLDKAGQLDLVRQTWADLPTNQRFVWHKLITGEFRVGVGRTLVVRALAQVAGLDPAVMAHRVMGKWEPTAQDYARLLDPHSEPVDHTQPYPFYLAYPLEGSPADLGPRDQWQIEWKWDGIRAQVIHRQQEILVWTRGEELVTDVYPEIAAVGAALPSGTVIDGEILAWRDESPLSFNVLQQRIGRKRIDAALLRDAPVLLIVYDLLEWQGEDWRTRPLEERRQQLAHLIAELPAGAACRLSPLVEAPDWQGATSLRAESRSRGAEGFMIKRLDGTYGVGRVKGDWWKWKIDPYTVDAVMIYAQPGHGRRASLYTDYTFAVWANDELVPIAKAYSGLTDEEIRQVDAFVRRNTTDRFGPVRAVKPELVFELAFEGIQSSSRHKSGIALRFPRMARWRHDKRPHDADHLSTLQALLGEHVQ